ncbi:MAG: DUF2846 domain-containing protein [Saprospiraceae bacterium]|nr:DUF2846 domain-containing protein [Saprospiraceae bacterium]
MKNILYSPVFTRCICGAMILLAACTSTQLASGESDKLKSMTAPSDMALVYVIRPSSYGGVVRMELTCDGNNIGSTQGKQFIYTLVPPGKHEFISKSENKDALTMVVEAGKTYFLEQKVSTGWVMARTELVRIMDESKGRQKLGKCKLSSSCPAYTPPKQ